MVMTAGEKLTEERATLLTEAKSIVDGAKSAGRELTKSEGEQAEAHMTRIGEIDAWKQRCAVDAARLKKMAQLSGDFTESGRGFLTFNTKAMARELIDGRRYDDGPMGIKALITTGSSTVGMPLLSDSPVDKGHVATGLLDVIPVEQVPREYAYLRQTARTNNAAVVASGALKPTSTYTLERVEGHLRVVAHLSEPIDKFWLEDSPTLHQFVSDELLCGLRLGVEDQIVNGTGIGDNFTGLKNTTGVQTQAFATDKITTCRAALTDVETAIGDGPGFYVLNPADWAAIETTTIGNGYALNSAGSSVPVESATRRLWGQPVVTTNAQVAGAGYYVQRESVRMFANGQAVVEWSTSGDDFTRNLIRARCEGRFDFVVPRPMGVVKMALTGA